MHIIQLILSLLMRAKSFPFRDWIKKQPSKLIARVYLHREITSQIGKRLSQRGRN